MSLLISPAELAALLAGAARVVVLDVRWRLDRPDGRPEYLTGHIPGAVWVDLERELSTHGDPAEGRHPLPARDELQVAARRWGLREGDTVVVYDDANALPASRAWWLLTGSGVADVRLLDGGLQAWADAGLPLQTGEVTPEPGSIVLTQLAHPVLSTDEAATWPGSGILLDVRAPERYRGETEPIDPVAGHIPGARNLPIATLLESGRFRDAEVLRDAFAAVGAVPGARVAAYCGSGITAAQTAIAGVLAGVEVAVYPGSWSAWSNTPGRPVATGD